MFTQQNTDFSLECPILCISLISQINNNNAIIIRNISSRIQNSVSTLLHKCSYNVCPGVILTYLTYFVIISLDSHQMSLYDLKFYSYDYVLDRNSTMPLVSQSQSTFSLTTRFFRKLYKVNMENNNSFTNSQLSKGLSRFIYILVKLLRNQFHNVATHNLTVH